MQESSSYCHSEERSDEGSTISPPAGERYREGVFAFQLTKTEQLPLLPRLDKQEHMYHTTYKRRSSAHSHEETVQIDRGLFE